MFVDHFRGIHVTRNKRDKVWRYTYRFPCGIVFHTSTSRTTRAELKQIEEGTYQLKPQYRESYSVSPKMVQEYGVEASNE